jgi:predicted RND superfamily exporter protein
MRSLGFGLDRIARPVLAAPRMSAFLLAIVLGLVAVGLTRVSFDDNLRTGFAGNSQAFTDYERTTNDFADPENEILLLVEGDRIGDDPDALASLEALQFELQLVDGVASVASIFALRGPPGVDDNAAPLIADVSQGLSPQLRDRLRAHPLLGDKLLSADGNAMIYIVTPAEAKAPLAVLRALMDEIEALAHGTLGESRLAVTITGFPAIRADVVDILIYDQIVLNAAAALVGLVVSLIFFGSFVAVVITMGPAVMASGMVLGATGLLGVPMTLMSNVVPTLIVILAFADAMHLSHAWRVHRDAGASPEEAERLAQAEVGPACMLTAITTSLAFLSLTISDVEMLRNFGWLGAAGTLTGGAIVLVVHALLAPRLGRYWHAGGRSRPDLLIRLGRPCAAVCAWAVRHARSLSAVSAALFVVLAVMHLSVPAQQSLLEHLPEDNPANAALRRVDAAFGGIHAVQIVVPLEGAAPASPEALDRIGRVHRAIAGVEAGGKPLSLWSLVEWLEGHATRLAGLVDGLSPAAASWFVGRSGDALVTVTIPEAPTAEVEQTIDRIEAAARSAGGDVTVSGVAVLTARESTRTIGNLKLSLTLAIFAGLGVMMLAFRDWRIGVLAFLPNVLPIVATGALLYLTGRGMQFTSVLSLTVAIGIAVDDTIHYLNRFMMMPGNSVDRRLIEASRSVGPVLLGTTAVIVAGVLTTLASALPTVTLFGQLLSLTLAMALAGDLIVLPALMAGPMRRWFEHPLLRAG